MSQSGGVPADLARAARSDAERAPLYIDQLRATRVGLLLALFTVLFGFALGGAFGAFEAPIRADLTERAEAVQGTVYGGDKAKMKGVLDKSWAYYKRAHLHGGGIGAVAVGSILLLGALRRPRSQVRRGVGLALGAGALGYSSFWLLAARAAPGLGSTDAAKESLAWLAIPSAGLLLIGVVAVIALTTIELFVRPSDAV